MQRAYRWHLHGQRQRAWRAGGGRGLGSPWRPAVWHRQEDGDFDRMRWHRSKVKRWISSAEMILLPPDGSSGIVPTCTKRDGTSGSASRGRPRIVRADWQVLRVHPPLHLAGRQGSGSNRCRRKSASVGDDHSAQGQPPAATTGSWLRRCLVRDAHSLTQRRLPNS